jgi:hypothetical protein
VKANEFVKKYGVDRAKNITVFCLGFDGDFSACDFTIGDLKRLIESHELVESLVHTYKDIEIVREKASYCGCSECKSRLQAIADVESCQ